jgi:hypothetical protein
MADWRKGYLYQWSGSDWLWLDPKEHSDKYMVALEDLLEHAPDGAFNNLFCMNLIAQKAFVKYLQALEITLSELTENGQTKRGSIKSSDYKAGESGFKINYNGDVEFWNGVFRGRIVADTGLFLGEIESGPLSLANTPPTPTTRNFVTGSTAANIYNSLRITGAHSATGTYDSQSINGIEVTYELTMSQSYPYVTSYTDTKVYVYVGSTKTLVAHTRITGRTNVTNNAFTTNTTQPVTLGAALSVTFEIAGKTMRLIGLPVYPQLPEGSGIVYVDNGFLKVTP